MRSEFAPIIRGVKLLVAEQSQLAASGPHFSILHRHWQPGTICTPGEMIAEIYLVHRRKRVALPLSVRLMLTVDFLARHKHVGQHAVQIAAGLSADKFTRQHGAYAGATASLSKRVSRASVKQQMMRLREGLRQAFRRAGLSLDPARVLISEKTTGNEVRYRLKAAVTWHHTET